MLSDGTLSEPSRSPRSDGEMQTNSNIIIDLEMLEAAYTLIWMKTQGERPQREQPQEARPQDMHTNSNIVTDPEMLEAASILVWMKRRGERPQEKQSQEAWPQDKRPGPIDWKIQLSRVGAGTRDGEECDCQLWQGSQIEGCIWIIGSIGYVFYRFKKSGNDKFFALPRFKYTVSPEDLKKAAGNDAFHMSSSRLDRAIFEIRQVRDIVESRENGIEVTDAPPKLRLGPWTSRLMQVTEFRNEGKLEGACSGVVSVQDGCQVCEAHQSRDINRTFVEPSVAPKRKRTDEEASSTPILTLNKPKQNGNDEDVSSVLAQDDRITAFLSKERKTNGKKASTAQTPLQNKSQQNNTREMTSARTNSTPQLPTPPGTRSTVLPGQSVRTMRQNSPWGFTDPSNLEAKHQKKQIALGPEMKQTVTANIPDPVMSEYAVSVFRGHGDQSWRRPPKPKPKKAKTKQTKTTKK